MLVLFNVKQNFMVYHSRHGIRTLGSYKQHEIDLRLKTYYKFMFVRHPITRLVSAFREKFNNRTDPRDVFFYETVPDMLKYSGKFNKATFNKLTTNVDFSDFLNYAFASGKMVPGNNHWGLMENLCSPCVIQYDFIGTQETFTQDTKYLLSTVFKSNQSIPAARRPTDTGESTSLSYFKNISKGLVKKVIDFYTRDALLFNYNLSTFK